MRRRLPVGERAARRDLALLLVLLRVARKDGNVRVLELCWNRLPDFSAPVQRIIRRMPLPPAEPDDTVPVRDLDAMIDQGTPLGVPSDLSASITECTATSGLRPIGYPWGQLDEEGDELNDECEPEVTAGVADEAVLHEGGGVSDEAYGRLTSSERI